MRRPSVEDAVTYDVERHVAANKGNERHCVGCMSFHYECVPDAVQGRRRRQLNLITDRRIAYSFATFRMSILAIPGSPFCVYAGDGTWAVGACLLDFRKFFFFWV